MPAQANMTQKLLMQGSQQNQASSPDTSSK
jgi:hypothetical protein